MSGAHGRDPGDAWVLGADGAQDWGGFGAAGPAAVDAHRGILMQHRATWSHHGGTWGLPGGARRLGESAIDAALRETEEEIGLDRRHVELLGALPDYLTGTGFRITPLVGIVRPPFKLTLDAFEVAEAFEVPLAHFFDPANHQRHSMAYQGRMVHFHAMPYDRHNIWGATAGIIMSLYRLMHGGPPAGD